ncbi:MAG: FAD-binding protein [Clostridiales bacterium]|nr:FAD-binding protein [Clostridiales bacterium]
MELKYGRENHSADVLVIGGGIGGLTAAVSIKEKYPELNVLIVEKQTTGYSGKANKGGGVLQYFDLKRIKPEDFVAYHVNTIGCFLGDQDLMATYVSMNNHMFDKLVEWGAKIPKREDGSYAVIPTGPMTAIIGVDLDITLKMRQTAEKMGVKILDKISITDLLTSDGKIAGAVGFSLLNGKFYTFNAGAVVLATGSQNFRIGPMWSSGRGDGIAAAYRAGAEMRNAEFGNFAQLVKVRSHEEVVYGENAMYNKMDVHVTKNFRTGPEPDISSTAIEEWYRQMSSNMGPITLKIERPSGGGLSGMWDRPYGQKFWQLNSEAADKVDTDMEVCPMLIGEQSPVKTDHSMMTTIPGLYAVGDVSYCGSAAPGAVPAPPGRNRGSGILNAVFAGIMCSESAAETAKKAELLAIDDKQLDALAERLYAPLSREKGVKAKDVVRYVQKAVGPMEQSVYMNKYRMEIALRYIDIAKGLVPKLQADDFHELLNCHEAEAAVLSAEMLFKAALLRKESRGWFLREDYPETDNKNWLKWIIVKKQGDNMILTTEDVPYEKWAVKPDL